MIPVVKHARISRRNLSLTVILRGSAPPQAGVLSARGRTGADCVAGGHLSAE